MTEQPSPVAALDDHYQRDRMNAHRMRWLSVSALIVVLIGVVCFLTSLVLSSQRQIDVQQREISSSCAIWRTVGVVPPSPATPTSAPSLEGVTILVEARNTFLGEECGTLPPPSPRLLFWAAHYHLKVDTGKTGGKP